jgi:hypothetical protein
MLASQILLRKIPAQRTGNDFIGRLKHGATMRLLLQLIKIYRKNLQVLLENKVVLKRLVT